ncbi:unnamed protein product, partial [Rotaria sordida]
CVHHLLKFSANSLLGNNLCLTACGTQSLAEYNAEIIDLKKSLNRTISHQKEEPTRRRDQIDELQKRLDITDKYKNFILFE